MTKTYVLQAETKDGEVMTWESGSLDILLYNWKIEFPEDEYPSGSIFGYDEEGNETYYKPLR